MPTVQIDEELVAKLEQLAREKGVSLDELVRIAVEEKLARDEEFEAAASHVLAKNADLYERLA
jgi:hypothetical protein